jgi:hypothetical protein
MKKLVLISFALAATAAHAQLIMGNDQTGTATIWSVNPVTGAATALYSSTNANAKAWGMAADNVNSVLYWNNGGSLHSATFASLLTGTPTINTVNMTFNGGAVNFVGLGYNPTTGKLLGTRNIATEAVYEIDPATGTSTILWNHPSTLDFGGLEYDNGQLYGLSDTPTTARGLYRIDSSSQTLLAPYPAGETDIDGLAVNGNLAYYVTDGPFSTQPNLYVFDITTGTQVGTLPSPFTGSGTFGAATFAPGLVPEPATLAALALGGLALLRRRRK